MNAKMLWRDVGLVVLVGLFLAYIAGCKSLQTKDNIEVLRGITDAAKTGNVAGTLKVHIVGAAEAYQHLNFGIGNPNTIIDADLQFRFDDDGQK